MYTKEPQNHEFSEMEDLKTAIISNDENKRDDILKRHQGWHSYALLLAAQNNKIELVKYLLTLKEINPAIMFNAPIRSACEKGYIEVVELLLKRKEVNPSDLSNEAISLAYQKGHRDIVKLLLKHKKVNPNVLIEVICKNHDMDNIKLLLMNKKVDLNEFILSACKNGLITIVNRLLDQKKVDPSYKDNELLCLAVRYKFMDLIKKLLKNSCVDRNAQQDRPLCEAIQNNDLEAVTLLLSYRGPAEANPNARNCYALYKAVERNNIEMVTFLLSDPRVFPEIDQLKEAARNNFSEIARLLLDHGVNPNEQSAAVLNIAAKANAGEIVILLLSDKRVQPQKSDAFLWACAHGNNTLVDIMIEDARINPATGLPKAIEKDHIPIIQQILEHKNTVLNNYDFLPRGIEKAFEMGNKKAISILISSHKLSLRNLSNIIRQIENEDCLKFIAQIIKNKDCLKIIEHILDSKRNMYLFFSKNKGVFPPNLFFEISEKIKNLTYEEIYQDKKTIGLK